MTDSSEQWVRSMETVTAGETARIGGVAVTTMIIYFRPSVIYGRAGEDPARSFFVCLFLLGKDYER